jgi:hypothetical protein
VRPPLAFTYGNCVFGEGMHDGWASFVVTLESYQWLAEAGRHSRLLALVGALEAAASDVQILRVCGRWDAEAYASQLAIAGLDEEPADRCHERRRYFAAQQRGLQGTEAADPSMFINVSLRDPRVDVASFLSRAALRTPGEWWAELARSLSPGRTRLLTAAELERVRLRAERLHARLSDFLPVRPTRSVELQWLVRRAFCRGLGEPRVDGLHEPRALIFECNGRAVLAPLEADVMRWTDSEIEQHPRSLKLECEQGTGWQAQLVLGALPDSLEFPGAGAELMFAPLESLHFGVDIALTARYLPNELAVRLARRRIQDADQILRSESTGEQGVSDLGYERTQQARDLLAHLQSARRPPLLRATIALAVGAESEILLEKRVEAVRRAYGEIAVHRPLGDQLQLFLQHLPGSRTRVSGFDDTLTTEQVGAMMPTATHAVGAERGFYLGHTLSGSRRAVLFNLAEGSEQDGNATILCLGALGSGKTTLAQKLLYEGFLQGARVFDCDPKGDHRFHLLEDVAPHTEQITLRPDPALRGLLDPLRVAPTHLRHDATVAFLRDLLPGRTDPAWETAIVGAVERVLSRARAPTCLEVVAALLAGSELEVQVAQTLEIYARSGLTQLGFADAGAPPISVGRRQVTYLAIRDLPAPPAESSRRDYSQTERVGEQIVRLIAMFALHMTASERSRLKLFSFDEGWRLLSDPVGRTLLGSLQRMGRSELAVPIISTQLVGDALTGPGASTEQLTGATFVFGVRSQREAAAALALIGLDPDDRAMLQTLLGLRAGRCLFRDHRGRVEAIQVELLVPALLRAFSTTPVTTS